MPDCDDKTIEILESINSNISSITNLCIDLDNLDDVAKTISGDNSIEFLEELYPILKCDCNKKKIEKLLITLGYDEILKILNENNDEVEIGCQFCNKKYLFNRQDVDKLFKKERIDD